MSPPIVPAPPRARARLCRPPSFRTPSNAPGGGHADRFSASACGSSEAHGCRIGRGRRARCRRTSRTARGSRTAPGSARAARVSPPASPLLRSPPRERMSVSDAGSLSARAAQGAEHAARGVLHERAGTDSSTMPSAFALRASTDCREQQVERGRAARDTRSRLMPPPARHDAGALPRQSEARRGLIDGDAVAAGERELDPRRAQARIRASVG